MNHTKSPFKIRTKPSAYKTGSIKKSGTRILLFRHGETEWNRIRRFQGRSDVPLNEEGRKQARALAGALKSETIAAAYSSPLSRALETARIIASVHSSVPFFVEPDLVEMDLGDFEGLEAAQWTVKYPDFRKTWMESPASTFMPGGECLRDVQARAIGALERITRSQPPGTTLLVSSHNFVNRTLLCYALDIPLNDFRKVRQGNASLNVLYMQGEQLLAEVVDERSHLE